MDEHDDGRTLPRPTRKGNADWNDPTGEWAAYLADQPLPARQRDRREARWNRRPGRVGSKLTR